MTNNELNKFIIKDALINANLDIKELKHLKYRINMTLHGIKCVNNFIDQLLQIGDEAEINSNKSFAYLELLKYCYSRLDFNKELEIKRSKELKDIKKNLQKFYPKFLNEETLAKYK